MNRLIVKGTDRQFSAVQKAPPAKYYTHRGFIYGSLAEGKTRVLNTSDAGDNMSTVRALRALGIEINRIENGYEVIGGEYQTPDDVIYVGNSGSTITFLMGLAARAAGTVVFTGDHTLRKRPFGPLVDCLNNWGVPCWSTRGNGLAPIVVRHFEDLAPEVEVDGFISQYVSSPILLAPFAGKDITIKVGGTFNEPGYVLLTAHAMGMFGVDVRFNPEDNSFFIPAGQSFKPIDFEVPGDFALAAYGFAVAALTESEFTYTNLDINSVQPEKGFMDFLKAMGAKFEVDEKKKAISLKGKGRLQGVEWDANDSPDMVPLMAVLCALAEGKSRLYNIEQVRYKESDRITQMLQLNKMGARVTEFRDGLSFEGVERLNGAFMETVHDHRLAMGWVVAGLMADGETVIDEAGVASISYPGFIEDMQAMGLDLRIEPT